MSPQEGLPDAPGGPFSWRELLWVFTVSTVRSVTTVPAGRELSGAMGADSDYHKMAEHALAMLKVVSLHEGPDAAVRSAKHIVEAAAVVIAHELGPAETRRFLHVVGVTQGQEH